MRMNRYGATTMFCLALTLPMLASQDPTGQTATPRDLKTPSSRLVGHWAQLGPSPTLSAAAAESLRAAGVALPDKLGVLQEYFGPIDPATDAGTYITMDVDGSVGKRKYKVLKETPSGSQLIVLVVFVDGDTRQQTYEVPVDGQSLRRTEIIDGHQFVNDFKYVDGKIAP